MISQYNKSYLSYPFKWSQLLLWPFINLVLLQQKQLIKQHQTSHEERLNFQKYKYKVKKPPNIAEVADEGNRRYYFGVVLHAEFKPDNEVTVHSTQIAVFNDND